MADAERSSKRRRLEVAPSFRSSEQLHNLFQFSKESSSQEIKESIDQFSTFLSSIQDDINTGDDSPRQLKILKKYCDEQSSVSHDQIDFPDILATWSQASESNHEAVLAAVPVSLAQFFQTISGRLEFRDFGLSLCHSLLKRDQVRIFDKGLSAPRAKDFLISSSLQLLTEVINFDEGALANNVWARRDYLYRRLDGILGGAQSSGEHVLTSHQAALQFLAANLKYLDTTAKTELITHGKILYSAIRSLPEEQPRVILETLRALERWILDDNDLSKQLKGRCFNSGVLTALAKLYEYEQDSRQEGNGNAPTVRNSLHEFLLKICTSPKAILLPQTGWYPSGMNPELVEQDDNMIDLGLDSPYYFDDYSERVPVKNGGLSTFIQGLQPGEDILHANLITSIFIAAPELIADFFSKKQKFLVEPGDDPAWRGQFAFLFSVIQLDVPTNLGWPESLPTTPPPISIAIESLIPRPLDRAISAKFLQSSDAIIVLSVVRLLTIALEKLDSVLKIIDQAGTKSQLWDQAFVKLTNLFVERIPPIQDVITRLQSIEPDQESLRAAMLECIATYHKVLPSSTASSKFDASSFLRTIFPRLESDTLEEFVKGTLNEQVTHLLTIASLSSTTRWWHKAGSDTLLAPLTLLLKYCVAAPAHGITKQASPILRDLLTSKCVLSSQPLSLDALILSLTATKAWQPELATWQFLDNCMIRTMQRPVKYLDRVEGIQRLVSDKKELSLVACCVAEQWGFVLKKGDKKAIKNVATWIARLFSALDSAAENFRVLLQFKEDMLKQSHGAEDGGLETSKGRETLQKAFEKQQKRPLALSGPSSTLGDTTTTTTTATTQPKARILDVLEDTDRLFSPESQPQSHARVHVDLEKTFRPLPPIPKNLTGLTRWDKATFESEIQSGRLARLIRCLISPDQENRLQAFSTLQTVMHAVEQSNYSEKTQLYLLLGELGETVKPHGGSVNAVHNHNDEGDATAPLSAPPSIIAELAISIVNVLSDASSAFYRKTNQFLLRGPSWNPGQLLPYWSSETFLSEPESDDTTTTTSIGASMNAGGSGWPMNNAQQVEISHFLDTLVIPSLRTPADVTMLLRSHLYTRLFNYYMAPVCPKPIRLQILHVVYLTANISGGADTLVTRTGVREWLSVARAVRDHSGHGAGRLAKVDDEVAAVVDAVAVVVSERCDVAAIKTWEEKRPLFKSAGDRSAGGKADGRNDKQVQDAGDQMDVDD